MRIGRNSRCGCAKMAAKFASMMSPRISKRGELKFQFLHRKVFSQQSRDSTLKESSTKVPIDASLCSLKPHRRGKEVLRLDSDHIQASGFDCLRQHNQWHDLDTLHRLSALYVGLCRLPSVLHFAPSKQCSIPHVAPLGVLAS